VRQPPSGPVARTCDGTWKRSGGFRTETGRRELRLGLAKDGDPHPRHGLAVNPADAGLGDAEHGPDFLEGHALLVVEGEDLLLPLGQARDSGRLFPRGRSGHDVVIGSPREASKPVW